MTAKPPGQLTYKGLVYPWHCDHMNHMNVMWYVSKFDEATWAFFATLGLEPETLRKENRGMAALEQNIRYLAEAVPGDLLEVYTRPIEIRDKTIKFVHEMIDCQTGKTSATCELVGVYIDMEVRKGVSLPPVVADRAAALL